MLLPDCLLFQITRSAGCEKWQLFEGLQTYSSPYFPPSLYFSESFQLQAKRAELKIYQAVNEILYRDYNRALNSVLAKLASLLLVGGYG